MFGKEILRTLIELLSKLNENHIDVKPVRLVGSCMFLCMLDEIFNENHIRSAIGHNLNEKV